MTDTGGLEFRSVRIDPSVVDPLEIELLEDLILAAIARRSRASAAAAEPSAGRTSASLGDLGGLLGPGGEPG